MIHVCVRVHTRVRACVCVCVCERERERVCVSVYSRCSKMLVCVRKHALCGQRAIGTLCYNTL